VLKELTEIKIRFNFAEVVRYRRKERNFTILANYPKNKPQKLSDFI